MYLSDGKVSRLERLAPGLRGARLRLGDWPTPLREVDVDGKQPLWVKDEGCAGSPYGGNKVRKLEWLLPALRRDTPIVTAGAVGSNHVIATAWYAAELGLDVRPVLIPQPDTVAARRNAAVIAHLARSTWPAHSEASAVAAFVRAVTHARREVGRRPNIVWIGGSSPRGVLGWADGALELVDQFADVGRPPPRRVYVPAGSGGMAAGLLLGFALAGLPIRVHAVRAGERVWANPRTTLLLSRQAARMARRAGARPADVKRDRLVYEHEWFGAGYGATTPAGEAAAALVARHGIHVEPTYSAKALAAAVAAVRDPRVIGPVVWVNTANQRPLEDLVGGGIPDPPPHIDNLLTPQRP